MSTKFRRQMLSPALILFFRSLPEGIRDLFLVVNDNRDVGKPTVRVGQTFPVETCLFAPPSFPISHPLALHPHILIQAGRHTSQTY
ncbi:hypothetical protein LZ31DRAFT_255944 [Colletotrichum somersetense]|nr:hypothetical protein LZ31DRAFT_255944 [Colletotrichum somersetense]